MHRWRTFKYCIDRVIVAILIHQNESINTHRVDYYENPKDKTVNKIFSIFVSFVTYIDSSRLKTKILSITKLKQNNNTTQTKVVQNKIFENKTFTSETSTIDVPKRVASTNERFDLDRCRERIQDKTLQWLANKRLIRGC